MKGLGVRLRTARRAAEFSQTEVADTMGLSVSTITGWEKNRSEPGLEALFRLADLYGTSVAEILRPLGPNASTALERIHEAANMLSVATDTDRILELMESLRHGVIDFLNEKRQSVTSPWESN